VLFLDLAMTSAAVAAASARRAKVDLLARALTLLAAGRDPVAIQAGSAYLTGDMRQRYVGVGWAALRDLPRPALVAELTVRDVDRRLEELAAQAGAGSQARRRGLLEALFAAATEPEHTFLRGILSGELRQGAQAGLLAEAIAVAAQVRLPEVRRALLLSGDLTAVAVAALVGGEAALAEVRLRVGRPLAPMLAASARDVTEALAVTGAGAVADAKLDGVRIQVHRDGDDIAVFSRSLDDLTAKMPEIVAMVARLPVRSAVFDGEALAVDEAGRPRPFQETAGRAAAARSGALVPYFFDALHLDGGELIDESITTRWSALSAVVAPESLVRRTVIDGPDAAHRAFAEALAAGHEGLVIKAADSRYDVGRRGGAWVKVKPRHTLDLVVLAAEWGHGRRRGWLSNLHLGARDPAGGFVMLGKTFKGLTDAMLAWQTSRLLELAVDRGDWVVTVHPELVVEIAFDGVQTSSRYPGGVTLRFARVLSYRADKTADQADTIDAVRRLRHPSEAG
jgi:DNA ligase-1